MRYLDDIGISRRYGEGDYRDMFVCKEREKFETQALCITEHLRGLIHRKIKVDGEIRTILFEAYAKGDKIREREDIYCALFRPIIFDFDKYWQSSDYEKKQMLADTLKYHLIKLFTERKWNTEYLISAFEYLQSENYTFMITVKKYWISPNRLYKLTIELDWDLNEIVLYAVLRRFRKSEVIYRGILARIKPWPDHVCDMIDEAQWLSDTVFECSYPDGKRVVFKMEIEQDNENGIIVSNTCNCSPKFLGIEEQDN